MKHILRVLALTVLAALLLSACANVEPSITQQSKVYVDAKVEKSKLAVNVRPKARLYDSPKVLMYPFWIAQKMENHMLVGREVGRIFHQTWTGEEVFQTLAYDPELVYRGPEQAVRVARASGADLVVVGIVPYFITGGTVDSTALTLQIRIYETKTGNLLVSMDQSARVNAKRTQDWVVFTIETRLSDSPLAEAIASIAHDMAVPLKSWVPPSDEELGFADNESGMTRNIMASGSGNGGGGGNGMAGKSRSGITSTDGVKLKVEFDVDSSRIRENSYPLLNELAKALKGKELKGRRVVISGHADSDYTLEYNQKLSERRAASVKAYLAERGGIDPKLMRTEGFGKTRPLVPNTSPANKQRNRRVEVRLDGPAN
ncbi:OmpA family protein [Humidesulfovibrio idahonensis]